MRHAQLGVAEGPSLTARVTLRPGVAEGPSLTERRVRTPRELHKRKDSGAETFESEPLARESGAEMFKSEPTGRAVAPD